MLFLYNDAASYVLSAWRVLSSRHVQEQLVMLPLYNDAASYVCRRNETARYVCSSIAACAHCHTSHDGVGVGAHTQEQLAQLAMLLPCNDAAGYALSAWRVASCGYVQGQLVMLPCKDAASYACRYSSTTNQHRAVDAACAASPLQQQRAVCMARGVMWVYAGAACDAAPLQRRGQLCAVGMARVVKPACAGAACDAAPPQRCGELGVSPQRSCTPAMRCLHAAWRHEGPTTRPAMCLRNEVARYGQLCVQL